MALKRQRAAQIILLVTLSLLPAVLLLQIFYLHSHLENSTYSTLELLPNSQIDVEMQGLLSFLETRLEYAKSPEPPFPHLEAEYHTIWPTESFPATQRAAATEAFNLSCGHLEQTGSKYVSFSCASFVMSPETEPDHLLETLSALEEMDLTKRLRKVMNIVYSSSTSAENETPRPLPRVPFLTIGLTLSEGTMTVVYPGVRTTPEGLLNRDIGQEPGGSAGDLLLSVLHQSPISDRLVVTFGRRTPRESGYIDVRAEYLVMSGLGEGGVYLANLFVVGLALAAAYWYYSKSKYAFQKYLLGSFAVLCISYAILLLNAVVRSIGGSGMGGEELVTSFLPFGPSGTLLIMAGIALIRGEISRPYVAFLAVYGVEILAAIGSRVTESPVSSALFGFISLSAFGYAVWRSRERLDQSGFKTFYGRPSTLAKYCAVAYYLWGACQFALVFMKTQAQAGEGVFSGHWRDILFSEPGSFLVLLYAKGVAVVFTVSFLYVVDQHRMLQGHQESEAVPFLIVDQLGRIVGAPNFPLDMGLEGRTLEELLEENEDRVELREALIHDLPIRSYVCRLPSVFGRQLVSVTLSEVDRWGYPRKVWLHKLDLEGVSRTLDRNVCGEILAFAKRVEEIRERWERKGERKRTSIRSDRNMGQVRIQGEYELGEFLRGEGARILEKVRAELLALEEAGSLDPKMDEVDLRSIVEEEAERFRKEQSFFGVAVRTGSGEMLPQRLRMNAAILRRALACVFSELIAVAALEDREVLNSRGAVLEVCGPQDRRSGIRRSFVEILIRVPVSEELERRLAKSKRSRLFRTANAHTTRVGADLIVAADLIRAFDGELEWYEANRHTYLALRLRYLFSTWQDMEGGLAGVRG